MMRIGLLSDTHGFLDVSIGTYLKECDEIWHAGDFGDEKIIDQLQEWAPLQAVFGNIDSSAVRKRLPETLVLEREGVRLFMRHIIPRPNRYDQALVHEIKHHQAGPGGLWSFTYCPGRAISPSQCTSSQSGCGRSTGMAHCAHPHEI